MPHSSCLSSRADDGFATKAGIEAPMATKGHQEGAGRAMQSPRCSEMVPCTACESRDTDEMRAIKQRTCTVQRGLDISRSATGPLRFGRSDGVGVSSVLQPGRTIPMTVKTSAIDRAAECREDSICTLISRLDARHPEGIINIAEFADVANPLSLPFAHFK